MEVKYLGVILVDKLMWKALVKTRVKKGLKVLWSCNAFIDGTWGTDAQDDPVAQHTNDNP